MTRLDLPCCHFMSERQTKVNLKDPTLISFSRPKIPYETLSKQELSVPPGASINHWSVSIIIAMSLKGCLEPTLKEKNCTILESFCSCASLNV